MKHFVSPSLNLAPKPRLGRPRLVTRSQFVECRHEENSCVILNQNIVDSEISCEEKDYSSVVSVVQLAFVTVCKELSQMKKNCGEGRR